MGNDAPTVRQQCADLLKQLDKDTKNHYNQRIRNIVFKSKKERDSEENNPNNINNVEKSWK